MERITFVGGFDKTDLILFIAKALNLMGHSVMVVDTTTMQKSRFIVPALSSKQSYITTFEGIDVAIGFPGLKELREYAVENTGSDINYDYLLVDVDSARGYVGFGCESSAKQYFVTSMDNYSLKKGLMSFTHVQNPVEVTRIIYSKDMINSEITYVDFLSQKLKIKWRNELVYFPFENGDQTIIYSNQRTSRIRLNGLSGTYIDGLEFVIEDITGKKSGEVRKVVKNMMRD